MKSVKLCKKSIVLNALIVAAIDATVTYLLVMYYEVKDEDRFSERI